MNRVVVMLWKRAEKGEVGVAELGKEGGGEGGNGWVRNERYTAHICEERVLLNF